MINARYTMINHDGSLLDNCCLISTVIRVKHYQLVTINVCWCKIVTHLQPGEQIISKLFVIMAMGQQMSTNHITKRVTYVQVPTSQRRLKSNWLLLIFDNHHGYRVLPHNHVSWTKHIMVEHFAYYRLGFGWYLHIFMDMRTNTHILWTDTCLFYYIKIPLCHGGSRNFSNTAWEVQTPANQLVEYWFLLLINGYYPLLVSMINSSCYDHYHYIIMSYYQVLWSLFCIIDHESLIMKYFSSILNWSKPSIDH